MPVLWAGDSGNVATLPQNVVLGTCPSVAVGKATPDLTDQVHAVTVGVKGVAVAPGGSLGACTLNGARLHIDTSLNVSATQSYPITSFQVKVSSLGTSCSKTEDGSAPDLSRSTLTGQVKLTIGTLANQGYMRVAGFASNKFESTADAETGQVASIENPGANNLNVILYQGMFTKGPFAGYLIGGSGFFLPIVKDTKAAPDTNAYGTHVKSLVVDALATSANSYQIAKGYVSSFGTLLAKAAGCADISLGAPAISDIAVIGGYTDPVVSETRGLCLASGLNAICSKTGTAAINTEGLTILG